MSKVSITAVILLVSSAWTLALASARPAGENSTSSTQSSQQPAKSQMSAIEGCVSGVVDSFVLTNAHGKTYELTGNTNQLIERVGHKVRVEGRIDSVTEAELITAGGPHSAFQVEKVHSLSPACK